MKTFNKLNIWLIALVALMAIFLCAPVYAGNYIALINGPLYTNATVALGATYPTNTLQIGVVAGAGTNSYNMSYGQGIQSNHDCSQG